MPAESNSYSRLLLPHPSLAGCVRGLMCRSTMGQELPPEQRFNHYPATPLCSLNWWLAGTAELLAPGAPALLTSPRQRLPVALSLSGPQTMPSITWNPGPAHGLMLLLLPDALQRLTGLAPASLMNRSVDAAALLPPSWLAMAAEVAAAPDDAARMACIEAFLRPLWRAQPAPGLQRYAEWAEGLALHAASSAAGRSLRQLERRIRAWAGQPLRELRGLGRAERTFFAALRAPQPPAWAQLALEQGFADQSHLCRESRRITGCTPAELRRRIACDEGFWAYRVWQ
ncbi:helix-turn-helix domain-containing protein [Paucibacter soli]|uniref:helix-turn-helix domain-containing protein n=1 Tax=Paucibacter soli TaxID=3133433 RepID=UPI0030A62907